MYELYEYNVGSSTLYATLDKEGISRWLFNLQYLETHLDHVFDVYDEKSSKTHENTKNIIFLNISRWDDPQHKKVFSVEYNGVILIFIDLNSIFLLRDKLLQLQEGSISEILLKVPSAGGQELTEEPQERDTTIVKMMHINLVNEN